MNRKLEELSKKLDNEIRLKEEEERIDAQNKNEAETAGIFSAIKGIFVGAIVGFLSYIGIGIVTWIFSIDTTETFMKILLTILILIGVILGAYFGYDDGYHSKRKHLPNQKQM